MSYLQITPIQRNELSALLIANVKKKDIAKQLNKHRSNVWRELGRNKTENKRGYDARTAKEYSKQRRIIANQRFRKIENNKWLRNYIIRKIKECWSPEQIAGRIKKKWPFDKSRHIGKDSIYKFVYTRVK